jgi:hypothetical protein
MSSITSISRYHQFSLREVVSDQNTLEPGNYPLKWQYDVTCYFKTTKYIKYCTLTRQKQINGEVSNLVLK